MSMDGYNNPDDMTGAEGTPPSLPAVVDIHAHCLPGLDDGPADNKAAIALCRQMVADGTSTAIATPHQLGAYQGRNYAAEIRLATTRFNALLLKEGIPLTLLPGAEVRLDGQLIELLCKDAILTLADQSRHLLLELPAEPLIDLQPVISLLNTQQITVIVAHPERQRSLRRRFDLLRKWADLGAAFQMNAASLVGIATPGETEMAWKMVDAGLADFVASDCHSAARRPSLLSKAHRMLMNRVGYSVARRICTDNPVAVLKGESIRTRRSLPLAGVAV